MVGKRGSKVKTNKARGKLRGGADGDSESTFEPESTSDPDYRALFVQKNAGDYDPWLSDAEILKLDGSDRSDSKQWKEKLADIPRLPVLVFLGLLVAGVAALIIYSIISHHEKGPDTRKPETHEEDEQSHEENNSIMASNSSRQSSDNSRQSSDSSRQRSGSSRSSSTSARSGHQHSRVRR